MKQVRNRQEWCCEECGANGAVMYDKHEGVFSVYGRVGDSHRAKSPDCKASSRDLRVRNKELCSAGEWGGVCRAARLESLKRRFIVDGSERVEKLPTIEEMHRDLIRGGWEKVMSGVYKAPWGAMFRGPVLAWKIWAGEERTK